MDRLDNSPKAQLTSAPDRRLLGRSTIAALVLIAAAGLVVTALFVSNAGRNVSTILRQSGFAFRLESFGGWSVD
jgi:hypothetical protein